MSVSCGVSLCGRKQARLGFPTTDLVFTRRALLVFSLLLPKSSYEIPRAIYYLGSV